MLDIKAVRQDPEAVALALTKRGFEFDVAQFRELDAQRKHADVESQNLLAQRKAASKQIGALIGQGMSVDDAKAQVPGFGPVAGRFLNAVCARLDLVRREQARRQEVHPVQK